MDMKIGYGRVKGFNDDGTMSAYASTLSIDRDNEIILPTAYLASKESFMKNPVLLQFHDYWDEPVGKIVNLSHDEFGIVMDVEFAPTEAGEKFKTLYKGGFMNAFSIGFIPKEYVTPNDEEYATLGLKGINKSSVRRVYTEIELLEVSCVPVPANRDAVTLAVKAFIKSNPDEYSEILDEIKELQKCLSNGGCQMPKKKKTKDTDEKTIEKSIDDKKEEVIDKETPITDEKVNQDQTEDKEAVEATEAVEDVEVKEEKNMDMLVEKLASVLASTTSEAIADVVAGLEKSMIDAISDLKDSVSQEVKVLSTIVSEKAKEEAEKEEMEQGLKEILDSLTNLK
jgi:HK97 family phage prohead protease